MKETKRSLLTSCTALLLCFIMLVGTTFAWFTDEVTSANNIIKAGNLDINMYWNDDNGTEWTDAEGVFAEPVFDYDKWEPGHTEVRYIKVTNEGSLALKYQMYINPTGIVGKLADVIDVYSAVVTDGFTAPTSKTSMGSLTKLGTLNEVISGNKKLSEGAILPEGETKDGCYTEETVVCVAFHMQESAGNDYQGLSIGDGFGINLHATQYSYESDSFGTDYDNGATWPSIPSQTIASTNVTLNGDGTLANETSMSNEGGNITATLPEGVQFQQGTTSANLSVNIMESSNANITVGDGEESKSYDVHIDGIADGNDVPIAIYIKEFLPKGLNLGNYTLYHVENGTTNAMTRIDAGTTPAHNTFVYDPATGDVTLYLASFSEVMLVADTENAWEGNTDHSWYTTVIEENADAKEFKIANADQLWSFSQIVGGMAEGIEQDSFSGKTVTLLSDINLGDAEAKNKENIIFYPIGYWNNEGTYERKPLEERTEAVSSGFYNFCGTFDGNGHTVSNFYQNTWEMKGDHNWYDPIKEQYYRDGMGLFGKIYGGTVKNLTVENFSSDGEITTTGVIAAYADGATFENIAIFNCNPRVYNIGNGGIVGCVGWYAKEADLKTTFKNITVDNSNKISALWGSYDVACGGILGQYYPTSGQSSANYPVNAGIHFDNCHISAQMDVYNDVCANYQYYAYRYTGMLIGSVRENETIDGHVYPKMDGITAENCTVHFGTWNDYYYCEIIDNTTASYTHDYQMSRLTEIKAIDGTTITYLDGTTGTVPATGRANYVIVDYSKGHGTENATCYHFKDGEVWNHSDAGTEIVNGVEVLVEDKQHLYLEFNNLVTGYGWGVTTKGVGDLAGVTILDREVADSVEKFKPVIDNDKEFSSESTVTIGELFEKIENAGVDIKTDNVQVAISPFGATSTAGGKYEANTTDWTQGTLTFSGMGQAVITITDYYFCKTATVTVNVVGAEKFDTNFVNYKDYLYRVGNADKSTVALGTIFKHSGKGTIHPANVDVTFTTVAGNASGTFTANTSDWTKGTIQFTGTGVVKVTIKDDTSKEFDLNLEVVDAKNYSGAQDESLDATANNVVLLTNIGGGFTVSGRYTVYGNGFTLNYTGNGQYLNNGLKQGVVTVSENGTLDNLRVVASIYPYMAFSYNDVKDSAPKEVDGTKTRYYYQLSAISASGNSTITNCYVYGGRTNIFIGNGNVTIKDTILECGVAANAQIISSNEYTVTLENVTTIQKHVKPTIGDEDEKQNYNMLGLGILFGELDKDATYTSPKLILDGDFKQYNWATKTDSDNIQHKYSGYSQTLISEALKQESFKRSINGNDAVNMGIVFLNSTDPKLVNNTGLNYAGPVNVSILTLTGNVYSLSASAPDSQVYSDVSSADRTTENDIYKPQFKYDSNLGGQYVAEGGDSHCYREVDTIKVMFPSGDIKEIDLSALVNISKYAGQNLNLVISVKDSGGNPVTVTNGKITLSAADTYTVTYTVTDTMFYDKDGKTVTQTIKYSWDVTISVSLKDKSVPNAYFEFDSSKQVMGYSGYSGSYTQFIPFLAGLKIWDYVGQNVYERFNGDSDFAKVAKVELTASATEGNHYLITVTLTDGGVITLHTLARADSGGSKYTGSIKTRNNVIYYVNDGTTSASNTTWTIDYYKFTGNNGVEINSGAVKFNGSSSTSTKPSSSFGTSIKYTVTYEANSGNCGQTTGYATSVSAAVTLPTPTRSGYIFAGWYTAASGGTRVGGAGESYTPSANITLYAQWGKPCDVTYEANGGSCGTTSEKYTGTALTLPTATRDGYWFIGWYDAAEGGNKIGEAGATYNPAGEITLYAHWQEQIKYTVTYNANGGSCGTTSATYEGSALTLPTPTRTGYTFNGWYTATSGGTKIEGSYIPSANITLYAQWTVNSYKVTTSTSNATITGVTNGQTIEYGTTVSVTVGFDKSNSKTFTVKNDTTGETILNKSDAGTYTFTMPDSSVTISASSSGTCFTPDTLITLADGTQKRVDELQLADKVLAWDFFIGTYVEQDLSFIINHGESLYKIANLGFSDGTELRIIAEHGVFDYDLNKFVYLSVDNMSEYIGHRFVKYADDGSYDIVTLTSAYETEEFTTAWSITTTYTSNAFASGLLTVGPPDDFYNWIEMDGKLHYDVEQFQKDVETYGLYTYEDFADYLTYEQFVTWNGAYLKIAVEKGYFTFEYILELLEIHGEGII